MTLAYPSHFQLSEDYAFTILKTKDGLLSILVLWKCRNESAFVKMVCYAHSERLQVQAKKWPTLVKSPGKNTMQLPNELTLKKRIYANAIIELNKLTCPSSIIILLSMWATNNFYYYYELLNFIIMIFLKRNLA